MVTNKELIIAFNVMKEDEENLYHVGEQELKARETLKRAEASVINSTDPKVLGSNDKARDAKIRELTCNERANLEKVEDEKRAAQLDYEISCMTVDCLKWQIRNDQVAADWEREGLREVT